MTAPPRWYWRRNLRITAVLTMVWFAITFGSILLARDLSFSFLGWPLSFWIAAQGAPVFYVLLVAYYTRTMNRLDREFRENPER